MLFLDTSKLRFKIESNNIFILSRFNMDSQMVNEVPSFVKLFDLDNN